MAENGSDSQRLFSLMGTNTTLDYVKKEETEYANYAFQLTNSDLPHSEDIEIETSYNFGDDNLDEKSVVLNDEDLAIVSEFVCESWNEDGGFSSFGGPISHIMDLPYSDDSGIDKSPSLSPDFTDDYHAKSGLNLPCLPEFKDMIMSPASDSVSFCDETTSTSNSSSDESDDEEYNPPKKKGCKSVLLWRFLLNVLVESEESGLMRWDDRRRGVFKFVDTARLSTLWGNKKNKPDMTFEKLSRGIRHYYRSGLMSRISGKRLFYKFNWKKVPKLYRPKI